MTYQPLPSATTTLPPTATVTHDEPLLPNLPNDVALHCIARVPRSHDPYLSLVCRSWRDVVRSPIFLATRRAINSTESFLYINLRCLNPADGRYSYKWFALDIYNFPKVKGDSRTYDKPKSVIPLDPSPVSAIGSSYVALNSKIYVIGGSIGEVPSSKVWVLDPVLNKWEIGPEMRVGREFAAAGVVGGKIYVLGGCVVNNWARSMNWAEVFDPATGSWSAVPSPVELREKWMHASAVVGGKIYAMADRGGVVFDPELREWGPVPKRLDMGWRGRATVVDGVLYSYDYIGKIKGFDVDENVWKELRGVEKDLPNFLCGATMANVGGSLSVVWEGKRNGKDMEIRCVDIKVKKVDGGELWGSVVWTDVIHVLPAGSSVVHCLGVGN